MTDITKFFIDTAKEAFVFLINEYGMKCKTRQVNEYGKKCKILDWQTCGAFAPGVFRVVYDLQIG